MLCCTVKILNSHYNVKCGSFIRLNCHCSSAYSLNTLIHLSHLGNSLQILFGGQKAPAFAVIHE